MNFEQSKDPEQKILYKSRLNRINLHKKWSLQTTHEINPETSFNSQSVNDKNDKLTKLQCGKSIANKKLTINEFLEMSDSQFINKYQQNLFFKNRVDIYADQCLKIQNTLNKSQKEQFNNEGNSLRSQKNILFKEIKEFMAKYNKVNKNL